MRIMVFAITTAMICLSACKPPATDGFAERQQASADTTRPSPPLDSPDTQGALWSQSATPMRVIYGKPGEPPMIALACETESLDADGAILRFTRFAQADEGAQAFLALIGNGHVARIPVDAIERNGASLWEGIADPTDRRMEVFSGARTVTATIPGAGMVRLNPNALPGELVEQCADLNNASTAETAQPVQ